MACEEVLEVVEGERTESDHIPIEVKIEGPEREKVSGWDGGGEERIVKRSDWSAGGVDLYHRNCEGWRVEGKEVEDIWKEIRDKVDKSIKRETKKVRGWALGERMWHKAEWRRRKRELRKEMRRFRGGKINREEFVKKRKEHRKWCAEEKERYEREEMEKIKLIKSESEAWKYINKYRGKKRGGKTGESIDLKRWKNYFMLLLGGQEAEEKGVAQRGGRVDQTGEEETEGFTREKMIHSLRNLKRAKAPGADGLENEAWRLMPMTIGEEFWRLMNAIWRGGVEERDYTPNPQERGYSRHEKLQRSNAYEYCI